MSAELRALGRKVAAYQDDLAVPPPDEALRSLLASHAAARRIAPKPSLWRTFALGLAGGLVTAIVGFWLSSRLPARALEPSFHVGSSIEPGRVGYPLRAGETSLSLRFFEGSELWLEPRASARVVRLDSSGGEVTLDSGAARVEVAHLPGARWIFRSGPYTIEVKGTRFELSWNESKDAFALRLLEGRVVIKGCAFGRGTTVVSGQTAHASCARHTASVGATDGVVPDERPEEAPSSRASLGPPTREASGSSPSSRPQAKAAGRISTLPAPAGALPSERPSWLGLARAGRYAEAYAALEALGVDTTRRSVGPEELLLLADTARLSGRTVLATSAYHEVRDRFPATRAAADAAFELGRLAVARTEAARWFRTYLDEAPDGPLASAALGRLLEAELDAGHPDAAQRAAEAYLARYPAGPHADLARRALEHAGP